MNYPTHGSPRFVLAYIERGLDPDAPICVDVLDKRAVREKWPLLIGEMRVRDERLASLYRHADALRQTVAGLDRLVAFLEAEESS